MNMNRHLVKLMLLSLHLPLCMTMPLAAEDKSSSTEARTGCGATLNRIGFGSCVRQDKPQPIWDSILAAKPQLFLMIGDNIYGDSEDMEVLKAKYARLGAVPGFERLRSQIPLLATWDDHDYGVNDGGAEYPQKTASQKVFCDFFRIPQDSPRRQREGVYGAYLYGPEGERVQVILLDTRYFRSPLKRGSKGHRKTMGPYAPHTNRSTTILGEEQWEWLSDQLEVPAEVRIIASSIQVVPAEHGWEAWINFPHERERLFRLIGEKNAGGVILISGDRHLAEISKLPAGHLGAAYPLYDVTSSSLNQPSGGGNQGEPNRYRVQEHYPLINFGLIRIDWRQADPLIRLQILSGQGKVVREQVVALGALQPKSPSR